MDSLFVNLKEKDDIFILVEDFYKVLLQRYCQFGYKCRQYIEKQHQQRSDILRLLAEQTTQKHHQRKLYASSIEPEKSTTEKSTGETEKTGLLEQKVMPFMVKRPRNAYNIFVQSESIKIKQEFPHLRAPDIVRLAAERYNNLTEEEKRPYIQRFQEAKRLFEQQHEGSSFGQRGKGSRFKYGMDD